MKEFFIILAICALSGIMIFNMVQKKKEQKYLDTLAKARNVVIYINTEEDEEVAQDIVKAIKLLSSYVNDGSAPPIQIETFQQGKTIYADIYYAPVSLRKLLRGLRATIYFY